MRAIRDYLQDILDQIERIERFTRKGQEAFLSNDETQYAVIHAFVIIGEAAKNLADALLKSQEAIDWRQIKGFRDFLVHSYHRVNVKLIWAAVEDLPNLKAAVEGLLNAVEAEEENDS